MNKYLMLIPVAILALSASMIANAQNGNIIVGGASMLQKGVVTQTAASYALDTDTNETVFTDAVWEQNIVSSERARSNRQLNVWVTAYTSDPSETDDTPFITASGTQTRDGVAAANFLPMGTQFRIPDKFGDKVFTVEDRMNPRYNNQHIVDIWFPEKDNALFFGKRQLVIELL